MSYQNESQRNNPRPENIRRESERKSYYIPLAVVLIALILGLAFAMAPNDPADDLAATSPAAGTDPAADANDADTNNRAGSTNPADSDYNPDLRQ